MTTFTKEQLIERAKSVIHLAARHPESHTARLDAAINETALAALTAVPAMYCMEKGAALDIDTTSTCKSVVDTWVDEWN